MELSIRERLKNELDRLYTSYDWDMPSDKQTLEDRINHVMRWRAIREILQQDPPLTDEEIVIEYLKLG